MTLAILMTGAGVVLLYAGGEALILGAVKLGQRARLSPLVIGLTVVAFGTSTPELAVSVEAALFGHDDVADLHDVPADPNIFLYRLGADRRWAISDTTVSLFLFRR